MMAQVDHLRDTTHGLNITLLKGNHKKSFEGTRKKEKN